LHQDISRVGALDLGFFNSSFDFSFENKLQEKIQENKPVVFLLGQDEIKMEILKNAFVVYLGHHGDKGASIADVILPTPAYTEKSSTYINAEGRVLQTSKCHSPLGESKEEWKVFRVLSDFFEKSFQFNNLEQLRKKIIIENPLFSHLFQINKGNGISFGSVNTIEERDIYYNIDNFYMNDVISKYSETMAKCTKEILNRPKL